MAQRWKGKSAEAKALADPMSRIVSRLCSSFLQSNSQCLLSGRSVILSANPNQTELLNQACFGLPIVSSEKDKQWFQLSLEEALYLCSVMNCISISGQNNDEDLRLYMSSKKPKFPFLFRAYSHLREKNWVVRGGSQYGVDFVAYRHHPSLVHSEYAVIVLSDGDESENSRLKAWSDFHCTLRLCGSVAKTLLVLRVGLKSSDHVEERVVTRWNPEQSRENRNEITLSES